MFRISPFYNESKKQEIKHLQPGFTPGLASRAVKTLICSVRQVGSSFGHRFWQSEKSILLSEESFFCPVAKTYLRHPKER